MVTQKVTLEFIHDGDLDPSDLVAMLMVEAMQPGMGMDSIKVTEGPGLGLGYLAKDFQ